MSMPPSTDCSAATSWGGCRSYSGADALGLLTSSTTATVELLPDTRIRTCVRLLPTTGRRHFAPGGSGQNRRKRGRGPSNTAVHADLHNLWTSRWTSAVTVWRPRGTEDDAPRQSAVHLQERPAQGVDGRKSVSRPKSTCSACRVVPAGHTRLMSTRADGVLGRRSSTEGDRRPFTQGGRR